MKIGITYRDKITGFTGLATGYVQYISGCNQLLLAPPVGPDGTMRDSAWFDQQRLEVVKGGPTVSLDNGQTPGFDRAAPRR
jgi:hypothetical protein